MINKFDIEVAQLKDRCEELLAEMEDICNEITNIIGSGDFGILRLVCSDTSNDCSD